MTKDKTLRLTISLVIVGVLVLLWSRQSDLAYNVAQGRAILLGRYTLETTITLLIVTPVLLCVLNGLWKKKNPAPKDPKQQRLETFKLITLIFAIISGIVAADVALRLTQRRLYVGTEESYHRAPNQVFKGVFYDRPEYAFSYPKGLPGYPPVSFQLTVDDHGFRNPPRREHYDWIVLGDSFAEGSSVSDEQTWAARLAERRGVSLYNLGMSGGSPVTYLDTLEKFGVPLKPKVALYMLYEGNDLRDSNFRAEKLEDPEQANPGLFTVIFKASPLRLLIKESLERMLGAIGSKRFRNDPDINSPSHVMYPVAWLPLEVPAGGGYGYAFDVKRLLQHYLTEEDFRHTLAYTESLRLLDKAHQVCKDNGITLVVIYAPDKPHTLIEDVLSQVPPEQLRAFVGTRLDDPPAADKLADMLRTGTQVRENVFRTFCREQDIAFISLTEPLREQTRQGRKTYYTYDQHWTPEGHAFVADYLSEHIASKDQ